MKKIVKLIAIPAAFALLLGLAGCAKSTVAEVNGEVITRGELDRSVARTKAMYEAQGFKFDGTHGADTLAELERTELEAMVNEKLMMQEAAKLGITVDDATVQGELDKTKAGFPDVASYEQALQENQLTELELKEKIRINLISQALYEEVTKDAVLGENDVENYYNENPAEFTTPEQVRASHILVETEEEANAILGQLKNGADFGQLAAEKSIDPTAKENKGDLGFFDKETMVKEFSDAAFAMKVGEISQAPVKTQFGYHIIKLTDRKLANVQPLEEVRKDLTERVAQQKKNDAFNTWMTKVKEQASIEIKIKGGSAAPNMPTDSMH